MSHGEILDAALSYAGRGWSVIALHSIRDGACTCGKAHCDSPGKHPRTRRGLKDGTTEPSKIKRWWRQWPDANVAICTGAAADIVTSFVLLFGFATAVSIGADLASPEALESTLTSSTAFLAGSLALGTACSGLGGYVAARVRNRDEIRIGIYFAVLMTVFSVLLSSSAAGYPIWWIVTGYVCTPIAAILGAYARRGVRGKPRL